MFERLGIELSQLRVKVGDSRVPALNGAADCTEQGGFYVDDPAAPQVLSLCPKSCTQLRELGSAVLGKHCGEPVE
jgi:hypothetical protein